MSRIRRLLGLLALWLSASVLAAQPDVLGYLTGPNNVPVTGARLTLSLDDPPRTWTQTSDIQGFFRFSELPAGTYRLAVEADGYAPLEQKGLELGPGTPRRLSLRLTAIRSGVGEVSELAAGASAEPLLRDSFSDSPISSLLKSVDSTGVLSRSPAFHDDVEVPAFTGPVFRGPSFYGAGPGENRYQLDGLDITLPMNGQAGLTLPLEFLRSVEVTSGGSPLESSGATGARIDLSSRFGGNEFHGDLFFYVTPYQPARLQTDLTTQTNDLTSLDRPLIQGLSGLDLGGYLVRDRLWFFLGVASQLEIGQVERTLGITTTQTDQLSWQVPVVARLTFNVTPDQTLQLSGYGVPGADVGVVRPASDLSTGLNGDPSTFLGERTAQALAVIGRYALRLPRFRTRADLQLGYFGKQQRLEPDSQDLDVNALNDGDAPQTLHTNEYAVHSSDCGAGLECSPYNYRTGGYGELHNLTTHRIQARLDVSHRIRKLVGDHYIKWGALAQNDLLSHQEIFTGGILTTRYPQDDSYVDVQQTLYSTALRQQVGNLTLSMRSLELAAYAYDRWTPFRAFTLDYGLRISRQSLLGSTGTSYVLSTAVSPRLNATFDYHLGLDGSLFAGYARNSSAMPLWLAEAAFDTGTTRSVAYNADGTSASQLPSAALLTTTPSSRYALASSLAMPSQDELVAGIRQQLPSQLRASARVIYRNLRGTIEPLAYPNGLLVLGNPGVDPGQVNDSTRLTACFNQNDPFTRGTQNYCYTVPVRTYEALELHFTRLPRSATGLWIDASYVLSRLEGDYPGPVPQVLGSQSTGAASLYNLLNLTGDRQNSNRFGPLPADRTHRLQLDAAVALFFGLRVGAGVQARSGAPLDVLGMDPNGNDGTVLLYPRGAAGRGSWVIDQAVSVGYQFRFKDPRILTLEATAFNPLQLDAVVRDDRRYVLNVAQPVTTGAFAGDSQGELTCIDQGGVGGATTPCTYNPGFGQTVFERQAPFSVRVMARYSF